MSGVVPIRNTRAHKEDLLRRMKEEAALAPAFVLPLHLDLTAAVALVGNLQLALRHPANNGPSAGIARDAVDGIVAKLRDSGYEAHAEACELGDNPAFDE